MARQINTILPVDVHTKVAGNGSMYLSQGAKSAHSGIFQTGSNAMYYWLTTDVYTTHKSEVMYAHAGNWLGVYAVHPTTDPENPTLTDQGGYYCLSFMWFVTTISAYVDSTEPVISVRNSSDAFSTTNKTLEIRVQATSTQTVFNLILTDSSGTTLDTHQIGAEADVEYALHQVEVYFGTTSSDSWEWWVNGTSVGSGTTGDFSNSPDYMVVGNTTNESDLHYESAFIVAFQSGCSSTADRLGLDWFITGPKEQYTTADTDETNGYGTNATIGGDTVSSGTLRYLTSGLLEGMTSTPTFSKGSLSAGAKSAWVQANGICGCSIARDTGFDQPIGGVTSDPNLAWLNDNALYQEDSLNWPDSTTQGSVSSNYLQYNYGYRYGGTGWEHPSYYDNHTILAMAIVYSFQGLEAGASVGLEIRTNGWNESLYSATQTMGAAQVQYGPYWITAPTGGWTWANFHGLDVRFWKNDSGTQEVRLKTFHYWPVVQEAYPSKTVTSDPKWGTVRLWLPDPYAV